jgi:hypothetical protein
MPDFPPALDATAEDVSSNFYGLPVPTPTIKALSFEDGYNGRYCTKTQIFVPAHRLAWFDGKPYLDTVCPTETFIPPDPPQGIQ